MRLVVAGWIALGCAAAQRAVPAAGEPHHHTIYEDPRVQILRVELEPGESTQPHRHDSDYVFGLLNVWEPDLHFFKAPSVNTDRNDTTAPVREVVIELLQPQTGVRNVCAEILPGEYLHCHDPGPEWLGANLQIQFETDQTHFGVLQIAPNASVSIPPADVPPLLIALDASEAQTQTRTNGASAGAAVRRAVKNGDVLRWTAEQISEIHNQGNAPARFLVLEFGGAGE